MGSSLPATIAQSIRTDYIDNHVVKAGERLPSVRELKERYMTTNTTICGALGILENQGLVKRIHGKGNYVTEPVEERLPGRNKIIGTILPHPGGNSMIARLQGGIERCAREYGHQLMIAISNENYEEEYRDIIRLRESGCRGIVLNPMVRSRQQLRADFLQREFLDYPIVLTDMAFPEQKRSMVIADNFKACLDMTQLMIDRGHKRIAFMDWAAPEGELMSRSVRDRYRGYLKALKTHNLEPYPEDHWMITYPTFYSGADYLSDLRTYLKRWAEMEDRPTALIALEDNWALSTINVAKEFGISIPGDLDIAGFDDCPSVNLANPTFPTTHPSFEEMGEIAVHLLMQHINGEIEEPVHYMVPAPIHIRDEVKNTPA